MRCVKLVSLPTERPQLDRIRSKMVTWTSGCAYVRETDTINFIRSRLAWINAIHLKISRVNRNACNSSKVYLDSEWKGKCIGPDTCAHYWVSGTFTMCSHADYTCRGPKMKLLLFHTSWVLLFETTHALSLQFIETTCNNTQSLSYFRLRTCM